MKKPTEENIFEDVCARMITEAQKRRMRIEILLRAEPPTIPCKIHPHLQRQADLELTMRATAEAGGEFAAVYLPCSTCAEGARLEAEGDRLREQGVPEVLLHCTLDNWELVDEQSEAVLASVREFARRRAGFLVLIGNLGTGKSHLAVGAMRAFRRAVFLKQGTLLRKLRQTYHDRRAADPIEQCQQVGLLVLDEMGLSGGGRDELPMLHEILDFRYSSKMPTILTGNLTWPELKSVIGDRLADRLSEAAFKVLSFGGTSHRATKRDDYFAGNQE